MNKVDQRKQEEVFNTMLRDLGIDLTHIGKHRVEAVYYSPFGDFDLSLPLAAFESMSSLMCSICSKIAEESKAKAKQEFQQELKYMLGIE